MSHKALELFTKVPREHNCAQAVAAGCGKEELVAELSSCGGGRAPEGFCGALYASLLLVKEENKEKVKAQFGETAGAVTCREIKGTHKYPCTECVRLAAELVEKYR